MDHDERLRPYVTGLAIAWAREAPDMRHRTIEGSLAFVDISGFTTLTERLAAKGKIGAEEMSDVLNEKFAQLLEVAYSYGALLVKWGGDAVLLLFEGSDHAALACRAAHEMQRTMRRIGRLHTSVGAVQLRMSVGINSGTFDFFLVGDRHLELLVAGPAATATAIMEGIAEAGEVLISRATAQQLPERCLGAERDSGVLLRSGPPVDPRCRYWPRYEETVGPSRFLDPAIRDHLRVEVGDCEHRQVAIGFVEISGVDDLLERQGPGAAAGALHDVIRIVQQACDHHRVTFWETDISKDGFKILLIAGAPRSSGHDEDAMLRAAHAIVDSYSGPVRIRIGVNTGRVFNGAFGPAFRRTWSVKGDAVNLAARVMAKASTGQLLATETMLRRVASRVDAELLPPFTVKGKQHPVHAAVVRRVSTDRVVDSTGASAFVGRRAEMDVLLGAARDAARGHGRGIVITGDAGVGKSRLADHVVNRIGRPTTVLRSFGDDYESATAYYAVRRLLRAAIGHNVDAPAAAVADELRRLVRARCPSLETWLPLLAVPFDVDLPDTPETAAVQEEFRRPRTMALVVEFLSAVLTGTTVLLVDDVQVVDDLSAELLGRLVSHAVTQSWLIVLAGREAPAALSGNEAATALVVPPLSADDARALVLDTPGGQLLAPHVIRTVIDRAEGNPLFLHELTLAVSAADGDELPSTLEDLLAAQIDDLSPDARKLLRSVSVLGSRFDESLVTDFLDDPVNAEAWTALDHFLARHADGSRRFRSRLARDAAYEGLPFRRRVDLHDRAATAMQKRVTDADDQSEALSLHCLAARRYPDAFRYACIAGRRARALYANSDAATFFIRARSAARRTTDLSPHEIALALEELGDVHARLAELPAAIDAYRDARSRAPEPSSVLRGRAAFGVAMALARAGKTASAARWLAIAERELESTSAESEVVTLRGRITLERALLRSWQGRHRDAAVLAEQALTEAEGHGDTAIVGRALQFLDVNELMTGRVGDVQRAERALAIFQERSDLGREAAMWNQLGVRAYYGGDWNSAVEHYARARELHARIGDDWNATTNSANIAEILVDQGRLAEAEPLAAEALRVWRVSGTPYDVGFAAVLLARVLGRSSRPDDAVALLDEASAGYTESNDRMGAIDAQIQAAEVLVLAGRTAAARARLDGAEEALRHLLAATAAGPLTQARQAPDIHRLRGYISGQSDDDATAASHLRASLQQGRDQEVPLSIARTLDALAWLSPHDAPAASERDEIFTRLGVVWSPPVPRSAVAPVEVRLPLPREPHEASEPAGLS